MNLAQRIEAAALGPAPKCANVQGMAIGAWVGGGPAWEQIDQRLGNGAEYRAFCATDETTQRVFLLVVAESLKP